MSEVEMVSGLVFDPAFIWALFMIAGAAYFAGLAIGEKT
jgi:hypothetical protein